MADETMYADLDRLKAELKIPLDDTSEDDLLESRLREATTSIKLATRRKFAVTAETTKYINFTPDQVLGAFIFLPEDMYSITSIVNGDGRTVPLADIVTEPPDAEIVSSKLVATGDDPWPFYQIMLRPKSGIVWTYQDDVYKAIAITGRWGFSAAPPEPIAAATAALAAHLYKLRDQAGDVVVSPDGLILTPDAWPKHVHDRVKRYIKV